MMQRHERSIVEPRRCGECGRPVEPAELEREPDANLCGGCRERPIAELATD